MYNPSLTHPILGRELLAEWMSMDVQADNKREISPSPSMGEAGRGSHMPNEPFLAWSKFQPPPGLWERLKPLARQMRQEPTPAENRLWQRIRKRQVEGVKFRRQVPFERFLVDFCCFECRLVLEVDGPIHQYNIAEDTIRQEFLEFLGFRVLRFTNQRVFLVLDEVLAEIALAVRQP